MADLLPVFMASNENKMRQDRLSKDISLLREHILIFH